MSLIVDHSGRVHNERQKPSIKDILANKQDMVGSKGVGVAF